MFSKIVNPHISQKAADWGLLILRLTLGLLMLQHGYEKFNKILAGDLGFANPIGLGEPVSLYLTVFSEFFCSILLILGLFTRLALIPLIFTMLVIIFIVQSGAPFGDKEHAILFLLPYISLFMMGSGRFSIDNYLFKRNESK
jgi:putative oxidoreductase